MLRTGNNAVLDVMLMLDVMLASLCFDVLDVCIVASRDLSI